MVAVDTTFLIDLDHGHRGAVALLERLVREGEHLIVPAGVALEYAAGHADPRLAWARLRDSCTVVDFTADIAEQQTAVARAILKSGRFPGWADVAVALTALAYEEPLITADLTAFRHVPGLELVGYR